MDYKIILIAIGFSLGSGFVNLIYSFMNYKESKRKSEEFLDK